MFKGVTLSEFNNRFQNEEDCKIYLSDLKWSKGFECTKCNCKESYKGNTSFDKRCKACGYEESLTAQTMFHKIKFPLKHAFYICYRLCVSKKGMSTAELSRELGLRQGTCWSFKRKVQKSMESSGNYLLDGEIEVDEFAVGGSDKGAVGRSKGNKKLVAIVVEKVKGNKIGRIYAKHIKDYSAEEIEQVLTDNVEKEKASIKADCWKAYQTLSKTWNIKQEKSDGGKNFEKLHIVIMNFKSWLRGIHHKCSEAHMQGYLNEFCYRHNRRNFKSTAFHKLIERMIVVKPFYQKEFAL